MVTINQPDKIQKAMEVDQVSSDGQLLPQILERSEGVVHQVKWFSESLGIFIRV